MLVENPAPWPLSYFLFKCARTLTRHRIRGGGRLYNTLRRCGLISTVTYRVGGAPFCVPISNPDNGWDNLDVATYERESVDLFSERLKHLSDARLIDCGADIGTFSVSVAACCPGLREIIAIEPRGEIFWCLERNMLALPLRARAIRGAVADFAGKGVIRHSPTDPSGHACFLAPDPSGDTDVITIDSLGVTDGCVALKIDVEGGELQVLKGAHQVLSRARAFVAVVEAHVGVAARTGVDPIACFRLLQSIRPCQFQVAETGRRLDLTKPFLAQCELTVSNIIAWSE